MDLKNLTVFNMASKNMQYLAARQQVIAENIANSLFIVALILTKIVKIRDNVLSLLYGKALLVTDCCSSACSAAMSLYLAWVLGISGRGGGCCGATCIIGCQAIAPQAI